jgi:hypothetical protein
MTLSGSKIGKGRKDRSGGPIGSPWICPTVSQVLTMLPGRES